MPAPLPTAQSPYTIYFTQQHEIGTTYNDTFTIPAGKRFVIKYLNISCQEIYKDKYIKLLLTTQMGHMGSIDYAFVLEPVLNIDFPSGIYRLDRKVEIVADKQINVNLTIINIKFPDDELGDVRFALTGYLI